MKKTEEVPGFITFNIRGHEYEGIKKVVAPRVDLMNSEAEDVKTAIMAEAYDSIAEIEASENRLEKIIRKRAWKHGRRDRHH